MYRNFGNGSRWLPGTVVYRNGPGNYQVETGDGTVVNRHIDQLLKKETDSGLETAERGKESELDCEAVNVEEQEDMEDISSSLEEQEIIEIPSPDKWAEMLGIPPEPESGYSGGKIRHKSHIHQRSPYSRFNYNYIN